MLLLLEITGALAMTFGTTTGFFSEVGTLLATTGENSAMVLLGLSFGVTRATLLAFDFPGDRLAELCDLDGDELDLGVLTDLLEEVLFELELLGAVELDFEPLLFAKIVTELPETFDE